jgi:hypothetical protein
MINGILFASENGPGILSHPRSCLMRGNEMNVSLIGWVLVRNVKNMAGINLLSCEAVYDTKIMKHFPCGKA